MRKFSTLSILMLFVTFLFAQAPEKFTYQAVVRNANNQLVINSPVGVRVSILQGGVNGTLAYMETWTAVTNANGLITLQIGGGNVQQGVFSDIDWASGPYFLKTETDPDGGSNYSITSTQQLLSVPYALYAKDAGNGFSGDYNDLTNTPTIPTVPTNVGAFTNDAGYLTSYTETDPQYNAWDKDYNDLINKPTIPTVPSNVSTFTNDAGYVTTSQLNAANYVTAAQIPAQVNADWNATTGAAQILNKPTLFSGNYYDLTNKPTLFDGNYNSLSNRPNLAAVATSGNYNDLINKPSIPTAVGELTNNVGYITLSQMPAQVNADWNATSGAAQILNKPTLFSGNYNDLTNKPTIPTVPANVSAFTNDAGYITSQDIPAIPTVPSNVSAFANDAGYLTGYAETDPQFNAWDKDYNDLTNKPTIPTVPSNVSAFTNDAGYLTSYTETDPNVPAWAKEATKPSYDYTEITNTPEIPAVPTNVSAFTNDAGYITGYTETDPQFNAWDKDYNDLTNKPTIPTVPTNVSAFTNDAGYITAADVPAQVNSDWNATSGVEEILNKPTNVSSFTNDAGYMVEETQALSDVTAIGNSAGSRQLKDVSDPTESYDAVNLRTLTMMLDSLRAEFQQMLQQQHDQMQHQIDSLKDVINSFHPDTDNFVCGTSTVTDHEGNVYATVRIGDQCWTKENLRTTTSPTTGTYLIPAAGTNYTYSGKQARWYSNDSATYAPMNYGLLYNWNAAVDTFNTAYGETSVSTDYNNAVSVTFTGHRRGICPVGWHLPSDAEWTQLTNYVKTQSDYVCGNTNLYIAKALASTEGWYTTSDECAVGNNQASNNATGFSAVPAGYCYGSSFDYAGYNAGFWSSSLNESYIDGAYNRYLDYYSAYVTRYNYASKYRGFSVRCLRDYSGGGKQPTVSTSLATGINATSATLHGTVSNPDNVTITAQGFQWKASQGGAYTTVSATGTTMSYNLTGLTANTGYTYRAFVTTAQGTSYGAEVSFTTPNSSVVIDSKSCPTAPTVTDHEGNVYATVQIGDQCWTRENLRTTTSPTTGTYLIPAAGTTSTFTGKQAFWYNNDSATYAPMNYGLLYNWNAAVDTFNTAFGETSVNTTSSNAVSVTFDGHRRGICPVGWHLPSDAEWTAMTDYVKSQNEYTCGGNSNYMAKALASETGWNSYSGECYPGDQSVYANNATGFSAFPAGFRYGSSFYDAGYNASFWSSSQDGSSISNACYRSLSYGGARVYWSSFNEYNGYSVRCLRDADSGADTTSTSCQNIEIRHLAVNGQTEPYCPTYGNLTLLVVDAETGNRVPNLTYTWSGESVYSMSDSALTWLTIVPIWCDTVYYPTVTVSDGQGCVKTVTDTIEVRSSGPQFIASIADTTVGETEGNVFRIPDFKPLITAEIVEDECYFTFASLKYSDPYGTIERDDWYSQEPAAGTVFTEDTVAVVITVTDPCGVSNSFTVNVLRSSTAPGTTVVIDEKSCPAAPTVTDHEGNVYATVQIGSQCWTRDNLRTTTSPTTGTYLIPAAGTNSTYTGKQAFWYNNDSATYAPMNYGLLYNWNAAVDTFNIAYGETSVNTSNSNAVSVSFTGQRQGICPAGWHLPSYTEWTQFTDYVRLQSGYLCDGYIAKALSSTEGWLESTNSCAVGNDQASNNATGFSAVPAGYCWGSSFAFVGHFAIFWSSSQEDSSDYQAWYRYLFYPNAGVAWNSNSKIYGHSVRCLRDEDGSSISAVLPTVSTFPASGITATSATCGGSVISDGGTTVTARGVCWSTSQNPTVSDSHTSDGSGTGSFNSSITGLSPNTTYYARAYATNSAGTAYGDEVEFKTLCTVSITSSVDSAVCESELPVIWNGVLFSTAGDGTVILVAACGADSVLTMHLTVNPIPHYWVTDTICDSELPYIWNGITFTAAGTQTVWLNTVNGCDSGVTMTVAVTNCTTGDVQPCPAAPTVTDHEGNVYATVQIGNQCWMRDNLRTTTSPTTGTYLIPAAGTNYTYTGKQAFWYNNDSATYAPMNYGLLYNWNAAVDTFNTAYGETSVNTNSSIAVSVSFTGHRRGICPAGWHLPSDAEWNTMEATVSGSDWQASYETTYGYRGNHAGKLAGGDNWYSSSTSGAPGDYSNPDRNASGFSAVPAGTCYGSSFLSAGYPARFWSSSQGESNIDSAYDRLLSYAGTPVGRYASYKHAGFSVRCLRD